MNNAALTVFYDGACPLCRREIGFYRRRRGAERLHWIDVSALPEGDVAPGLSRAAALGRFHVRTADGRLHGGGAAFARLWAALPGFRPLGVVMGCPPLVWGLEAAYRAFLPLRPRLQRLLGGAAPACPADRDP